MADDEIDFFKPHPNPKPRVKASFFEVVPDAFDDKSLSFTGDHRRVKKKPEPAEKAPEPEPEKETVKEEEEQTAMAAGVQESMCSQSLSTVYAEPFTDGVGLSVVGVLKETLLDEIIWKVPIHQGRRKDVIPHETW